MGRTQAVVRHTPITLWGRDHASTLLYAETCAVDHKGQLKEPNLRSRDSGYPTRLQNGAELDDHGDHECLEDMDVYGLLDYRRGAGLVQLTPLGFLIACQLRAGRAANSTNSSDGNFNWCLALHVARGALSDWKLAYGDNLPNSSENRP